MYLQPFDKHPADVGALRQTATELRDLADEALELAAATRAAYQPAIDNWHGMGAAEMAAAGEPVQRDAKVASQALQWSADVTDYWAAQVEGFNREVDAITGGLASQAADAYGATGTDGTPPTAAQVADARGAATAAAKQQWMQAYDTYIDTGRHRAAAMLARGPTEQNLAELREAGVLPAERAPAGPQGKPDDEPGLASKIGHGVLDVAGLIPVVGEPADAANAAWYAAEGDYTNAALSGAAMVPFLGWGATGAKVGIKGVKAAKGADEGAEAAQSGGPVVFRGKTDWTPEEHQQLQRYVEASERARREGQLSDTGRVSTHGELRRDANKAAMAERLRGRDAGTPYEGHVGHAPDTTWTGRPDGYEYHDQTGRVNSSLGAQARQYPEGYRPSRFEVGEPRE